MRAIQLKCYYTQAPAPEADRVRIQAIIQMLQFGPASLYLLSSIRYLDG